MSLASVLLTLKDPVTFSFLRRLLDVYVKNTLLRYSEDRINKAFVRIIISLKVNLTRNENQVTALSVVSGIANGILIT